MDAILTLSCADQPGIVHSMTSAVLACAGNIIENQQFTDPTTGLFMMRTRIESEMALSEISKIMQQGLKHLSPKITIEKLRVKNGQSCW
jgi:formyltetrahydrofolate deformylase